MTSNGGLAKPSAGMSTAFHLAVFLFTLMSCGFLAPFALVGAIVDLATLKKAGRRDTGLTWTFIIIYATITLVGLGLLVTLAAVPLLM
ncbi:hypothetical protein [Mycobacterium sp. ACS4331]|uniref:hypothetical protein n=1 Tax=Mycobacterium sp. ACS4331 TaxID=1834121 RepID=UPI0012F84263|nr:hypothetical protein [Mycobacterium sp. ACS4331]